MPPSSASSQRILYQYRLFELKTSSGDGGTMLSLSSCANGDGFPHCSIPSFRRIALAAPGSLARILQSRPGVGISMTFFMLLREMRDGLYQHGLAL
jgi:hypothetical protein